MSTKLRILVTEDILKKTANCESGIGIGKHCAISVAIRDIFPKAYVENADIWPYGERKNSTISIALPKEARNFIRKFDLRKPKDRLKMNPIAFEIEIPNSIIRKINIDELRPLLKNHPTLELTL